MTLSAMKRFEGRFRSSALLLAMVLTASADSAAALRDALAGERFGLARGEEFRLVDGRCADCAVPKQALWYFQDDVVAVPLNGGGNVAASPNAMEDLGHWLATPEAARSSTPFMIWVGAPKVAAHALLRADAKSVRFVDGSERDFALVPRLASNRAYFDQASAAFFAERTVRLRGDIDAAGRVTARVMWPEDFQINAMALTVRPLVQGETFSSLVAAEHGGAQSEFSVRLIWEREGSTREWDNKAVLAAILNGAQGDDDEGHGGHFAIVTGLHREEGRFDDWLVNNFYNLNNFSEKGITAAMVPMDNYLMDLNSGQSYYRPSYLLVAVLREAKAALLFQGAIQRVYAHFYRHDFEFDHAKANCVGISIDTLRALGWRLPDLGPTSYPKAALGYFSSSLSDRSFAAGRKTFAYLVEERTRLYPRMAFETMGHDLLHLVSGPARKLSPYESALATDVEAILFVRIPQIPSSRAFGADPVRSFDHYMARVPEDRSQWKRIPVEPRPFPDTLREGARKSVGLSDTVIGLIATGGLAVVVVGLPLVWLVKRRRERG